MGEQRLETEERKLEKGDGRRETGKEILSLEKLIFGHDNRQFSIKIVGECCE